MAQTLTQLYIHAVFSTKDRRPVLAEDVYEPLRAYMGAVLREHGSPAIQIGIMPEHVHMLFSLSKNLPLCKVMEEVKGSSSKWLKSQGERYRGFYWQGGYSGFSVSASRLEATKRYIQDQKRHHAKLSFQDEVRRFLKEYGIEVDEKYLWL